MRITRRDMLAACAAAPVLSALANEDNRTRLGVVIHSYGIRSAASQKAGEKPPFADPLRFVEHCRQLGAGGVQLSIGARDKDYVTRLRATVEDSQMYLEGSIRLPQDRDDVERFSAEVRTARDAGAAVLRCAILSGRRYETFATAADFEKFARAAYEGLGLAEPVVARHGLRLAVENHKDWRADELLDLLKRLGSRQVGVCVDAGNSIALLEDPTAVVAAYAPLAFTTHIKDMGVAEYADGFLLSEVTLGTGFLDLKKIIAILRQAQPQVRFNLEMITRDPLPVPCLTPKYWATFETLPARHLAEALARVRRHAAKEPLPRVSHLSAAQQLAAEEDNVRRCLTFAREQLGL